VRDLLFGAFQQIVHPAPPHLAPTIVETYFNYFTEIEEHFQRRRGTLLLMSPLDWALMETWKDAGIPLEAVLRGIDATFDKWERRPRKTRKVNGLAFCAQEVLAAVEELKEAAVGAAPKQPRDTGLEQSLVAGFLERNNLTSFSCRLRRRRWRGKQLRTCGAWRSPCRKPPRCRWKTWSAG